MVYSQECEVQDDGQSTAEEDEDGAKGKPTSPTKLNEDNGNGGFRIKDMFPGATGRVLREAVDSRFVLNDFSGTTIP